MDERNAADELAILDLAHLSAMTGGDTALALDVLAIFQSQAETWGRLLDASAPGEQWADAAHTLKGAALSVGAKRLAATCAEAERRGRAGDASRAEAALLLNDVRAAMGEALEAAASAAHKLAGSAPFDASKDSNS